MAEKKLSLIISAKDLTSKTFDGISKSAGKMRDRVNDSFKKIGIGALAVAGAGAVIGKKFLDQATEIQAFQQKSSIVFGEYVGDVQDTAKKVANSLGMTSHEYIKAATNIGDLLIPMQFTRKEATNMAKDLTSLSGALSEWSGGQVTASQVSDILAKAMLGEREQLKGLGIAISEQDVTNRLLEKNQEKLTGATLQQAKAVATLELIYEKSQDAQTKFAEGEDSLIRKKAVIIAKIKEMRDRFVTMLIPVFDKLFEKIQPLVNRFAEWAETFLSNEKNMKKAGEAIKNLLIPMKEMASWIKTSIEGWGMLLDMVARFIVTAQTLGSVTGAVSVGLNQAMGVDISGQIQDLKNIQNSTKNYLATLKQRQAEGVGEKFATKIGIAPTRAESIAVTEQSLKEIAEQIKKFQLVQGTFEANINVNVNGGNAETGKAVEDGINRALVNQQQLLNQGIK